MDSPIAVMRGRAGGVAQGPVGEALGGDRGEGGDQDSGDQHERQGQPQGGAAGEGEVGGQGAEAADHDDLAVGEVDELDDAVDHRVADRDEPVEGAEDQAVGQLLR